MNEIQIGDEVKIKWSPYSAIKKGTKVKVTDIWINHFGRGKHAYIVDFPNFRIYRRNELEK